MSGKAEPTLTLNSQLSVPIGTPNAVVNGTIAPSAPQPTGQVCLELAGVQKYAKIREDGSFEASFATGNLSNTETPYPINASYGGDCNYCAICATGALALTQLT